MLKAPHEILVDSGCLSGFALSLCFSLSPLLLECRLLRWFVQLHLNVGKLTSAIFFAGAESHHAYGPKAKDNVDYIVLVVILIEFGQLDCMKAKLFLLMH